jgi:hypothetical protein
MLSSMMSMVIDFGNEHSAFLQKFGNMRAWPVHQTKASDIVKDTTRCELQQLTLILDGWEGCARL